MAAHGGRRAAAPLAGASPGSAEAPAERRNKTRVVREPPLRDWQPSIGGGHGSPARRAPGTNRPSDAEGKGSRPPKPTPLGTRHFLNPSMEAVKAAAAGRLDPRPRGALCGASRCPHGGRRRDAPGGRTETPTRASEPTRTSMADPLPRAPRGGQSRRPSGPASGSRGAAAARGCTRRSARACPAC